MFAHEITDDDITYSESLLISRGIFDKERVDFIKNMKSLDLQSVPGSGKTTALLAKLTILERYMPFIDNKGIVVISHTNAAVNEWKGKIGGYCPKLFSYPNFVGTIQSFVNSYLAKPYMQLRYNITNFRVDDEIFYDKILSCFNHIKYDAKYNSVNSLFYGRNISEAEKLSKENGENKNKICNKLIYEEVKKLIYNFSDEKFYINGSPHCLIGDKTNPKYQGLKKIFEDTFKNGIISFKYAYVFSQKFIELKPSVLTDIRKRFKFAFVDEMQDMDKMQYKILEECFNHEDIIYQRIGDSNQSIFNEFDEKPDWTDRDLVLKISGSHRLSPMVAKLVSNFSYSNDIVIGLNDKSELKPHLIHFKSESLDRVIPTYLDLYEKYKKFGSIPEVENAHVGVISWVSKVKDDDRLTLASFVESLPFYIQNKKSAISLQIDLLSLENLDNCKFSEIYCCIFDSILHVLNYNNIEIDNRKCTKLNLLKYLTIHYPVIYENLNKCIYKWSMKFLSNGSKGIIQNIRIFTINMCKDIFEIKLDKLDYFNIDEELMALTVEKPPPIIGSKCIPQLGTIHSAKGQTHAATLYLESYYNKSYESIYLNRVFSDEINCHDMIGEVKSEINEIKKEIEAIKKEGKTRGIKTRENKIITLGLKILKIENYAKMIYVGLSRPKYFLCVAIEDSRYKELDINEDFWEVVSI